MNWEAIGAVGEILGAIAVFATLAYLATQIRQSNNLARFNASKELSVQFNDLNRMVATDPALRQVLMKSGDLSPDEREQIYNFAMMFCNVWMSIQSAHDNGQIDQQTYEAGVQDVHIEINRWPNFRPSIEQWLSNYPENRRHEILRPVVRQAGEK